MVKLYALGIMLILQTESNLAMETETRGLKRPVSQVSAPAPDSPSKVLKNTIDSSTSSTQAPILADDYTVNRKINRLTRECTLNKPMSKDDRWRLIANIVKYMR